MSRPLRILYPGAFYHIIQRGIERKNIFLTKNHFEMFFSYLNNACRKFNCAIHSYCLMSNHFHLILQTFQPNLPKVMHYLNSSYASYFNMLSRRAGHLFQGRYKAILIQQDPYLHYLSAYIHLNPIRAKIAKNPIEYPYSSYKCFVTNIKTPQWLDTNQILGTFSTSYQRAKYLYKKFVFDNQQDIEEYTTKNIHYELILSDDDFFEHLKKEHLCYKIDPEIPILNKTKRIIDTDQIIHTVNSKVSDKRLNMKIKIHLLHKLTDKTLNEIGSILGQINYKTISKINSRFTLDLKDNCSLKLLTKNIENTIMSNVET